jgi:peptidoglycan/xylan/chitin deacetylase (PgdA/CDA1 family)
MSNWNGKAKALTFSFDDAVTQDIRMIELLNKYGLKSTFNLNSGNFGKRGILKRNGLRISHYKVHAEDVPYIYEGHEIAVHTVNHPTLTKVESDAEVIWEVEQDRLNLSELAGYEVVGMAYPNLPGDARVENLIRNHTGVRYVRSTPVTYNFEPQENLYCFHPSLHFLEFDRMMELGQQFLELKADSPKLFYIWGHSYEMDYSPDGWMRLEEFFKLISGKEDIFYGTNKEILL